MAFNFFGMKTVVGVITYLDKVLIGKVRPDKTEDYGGLKYVFPSGQGEHEAEKKILLHEIQFQLGVEVEIFHNWEKTSLGYQE